jgi:hypothetical protein
MAKTTGGLKFEAYPDEGAESGADESEGVVGVGPVGKFMIPGSDITYGRRVAEGEPVLKGKMSLESPEKQADKFQARKIGHGVLEMFFGGLKREEANLRIRSAQGKINTRLAYLKGLSGKELNKRKAA